MYKDYVLFSYLLGYVQSLSPSCPDLSKLESFSLYCAYVMTTFYCTKFTCLSLADGKLLVV